MIKEEYKRLLAIFEKGIKDIDLESVLKEALTFFEHVRKEYVTAPKEEKETLIHMLTTLKNKLEETSQRTAQEAGISREELEKMSDDPSNFSPEQWRFVQETKRKLYDSARHLSSEMTKKKGEEKGRSIPREQKPIRSPTQRRSKKNWMKS